jgi:hypothetical protein
VLNLWNKETVNILYNRCGETLRIIPCFDFYTSKWKQYYMHYKVSTTYLNQCIPKVLSDMSTNIR